METTREELLDCIQNLIGLFDNAIIRRKADAMTKEALDQGRKILHDNGRSTAYSGG